MEEYDALGIGDRDTIIHSIEYSGDNDRFQFLVEFVESVGCANSSVSVHDYQGADSGLRIHPNPFLDRIDITGLKGDELFTIYNAIGERIEEDKLFNELPLSTLSSGVYFLNAHSTEGRQVLKLIKN